LLSQLPLCLNFVSCQFAFGTFQLPLELQKIVASDRHSLCQMRSPVGIARQYRIQYFKYYSQTRRRDIVFQYKRFTLGQVWDEPNSGIRPSRMVTYGQSDTLIFTMQLHYTKYKNNDNKQQFKKHQPQSGRAKNQEQPAQLLRNKT